MLKHFVFIKNFFQHQEEKSDYSQKLKFSSVAVLFFSAAVLEILAFPPIGWYWLVFVFAVPLFVLLEKESRLLYVLIGFFAYRLLVGLGIVYFTFDPIMFIASALIFLGIPLSFYLVKKFTTKNLAFLSLIILWPLWEFLEAYYTALPNFIMVTGSALGSSPFLGLACFGGLLTLSIFVIIINFLVFAVYRRTKEKRPVKFSIFALVIVLATGFIISQLSLWKNANNYQSLKNVKKLTLVSDNGYLDKVFKDKEFEPSQLGQKIDEALTPLFNDLKNKNFDVVVLPEAMIDLDLRDTINQGAFDKFKISNNGILITKYAELAKKLNKSLIANIVSIQDAKRYNTLLFFNDQGELIDIFNKKNLAITGEYWPFGDWRPFYFDLILDSNPELKKQYQGYPVYDSSKNFSRGETKAVQLDDLILAPAECSEIHYLNEIQARVKLGGRVILNPSSNLWLPTGILLNQYLRLADNLRRVESVWLKVPITSNGRRTWPALITPDGKIISVDYTSKNKNYNILTVEVRY